MTPETTITLLPTFAVLDHGYLQLVESWGSDRRIIEAARIHLPVGRYTRMRASANLRNWLGFLTLRTDPAAQWEIRQFAHAVAAVIEQLFPRTYELYISGGE